MYQNPPATGPAPSWADVWFWIRQWTDNPPGNCSVAPYSANNGAPLLLFENAGGFTHAQSDGAFDWVNPTQNQDDLRISPASVGGTVDNFYATSLNFASSKVVWGVAYQGFNDSRSCRSPPGTTTTRAARSRWASTTATRCRQACRAPR